MRETPEPIELNPEAYAASSATDALDDDKWFAENPGTNRRVRPPSAQEARMTKLPPDAFVLVIRCSDGTQARVVMVPDPKNAPTQKK